MRVPHFTPSKHLNIQKIISLLSATFNKASVAVFHALRHTLPIINSFLPFPPEF
jgi:hypothetical protein